MAVEAFDPDNADHAALVEGHVCADDNHGHESRSIYDPSAPLVPLVLATANINQAGIPLEVE